MKARELGSIVLKTLGVYWFVVAMQYLLRGGLLPFMTPEKIPGFNTKTEIIAVLLFAALHAAIGYLLVFRTDFLLRVIGIEGKGSARAATARSETDYKSLAFTLLGLYFVAAALSKIAPDLIELWLQRPNGEPISGMYPRASLPILWPTLVENVAKLIIGALLIVGQKRLSRLWMHLRPLKAARKRR